MKTNVYKRFDPRVMESEERIGINRGIPVINTVNYFVDFYTLFILLLFFIYNSFISVMVKYVIN
jgi:hypothetical protein